MAAVATASVLLLASLLLKYLPHDLRTKAGFLCRAAEVCDVGLPLWANAGVSFLVGGILLGLVGFAFASLCTSVCSSRRLLSGWSAGRRGDETGQGEASALGRLPAQTPGLYLVDDPAPRSCTVGFWRPAIVVSTGLLSALDEDEIRAVIAHEEGHRAGRDNMLLLLGQSIALTFAALPGIRAAYARFRRAQEAAADEFACRRTGDNLIVASSLQKFARSLLAPLPAEGPRGVPVVGFADEGNVGERIRGLLANEVVVTSRRRVAAALVALVLLFTVFTANALAITEVTFAWSATAGCHGVSTASAAAPASAADCALHGH